MIHPALFYGIALVVVLAAIAVVQTPNIFHAGLSLALTFGAVAAVYAMLDAHFLAVVQVLIYVGAIAVILKFAVMLTQHIGQREPGPPFMRQLSTFIGVGFFAALILIVINKQAWTVAPWDPEKSYLTAQIIGKLFLGRERLNYVFPFELVGVLLLMALIGAIMVVSKVKDRGEDS